MTTLINCPKEVQIRFQCYVCSTAITDPEINSIWVNISPTVLYPDQICHSIYKRCRACPKCHAEHGSKGIQDLARRKIKPNLLPFNAI